MIHAKNNLSGCISLLLISSFSYMWSMENPQNTSKQITPIIVKVGAKVRDWKKHTEIEKSWYTSKTEKITRTKENSSKSDIVIKFNQTY